MNSWLHKSVGVAIVASLMMLTTLLAAGQGAQQAAGGQVSGTSDIGFVLKTNAELVLTNVVVRDAKTGEFVRGLKQSDFSVYEGGKQQQI
jgi:hypothetical protein